MKTLKVILPFLCVATMVACNPLIGPIYDWSYYKAGDPQIANETQCRETALVKAGDRPRHAAGNIVFGENRTTSYGADEGARNASRVATDRWGERFDRAIKRCMLALGYIDPRSLKKLPRELRQAVELDKQLLVLVDTEAMLSYRQLYQDKSQHKAFAVSVSGAWAWVANRVDATTAHQDVLKDCADYNRGAEQFPCELVNLDGAWVSGVEVPKAAGVFSQ